MHDVIDLATVTMSVLLDDLVAEHAALDAVLGDHVMDGALATPAAGWNVRDTIAHLVQGEELAALAVENPAGFRDELATLLADLAATLQEFERWAASASLEAMADRWRVARQRLVDAMRPLDERDRIPWVLGDMSAATFARSRLMEAWAHGLDIADAAGATRTESDDRLRHVVYMGLRTHAFSFRNRGMQVPASPWRAALISPAGVDWTCGPDDAEQVVRGPARDFAAVVTQRRNVADTSLQVVGDEATAWLEIAQCFAGPATDNRPAGTFVDDRWVR